MIKIKKIEQRDNVLDIQVLNTNNFYANNILVHNCEIFQFTDEKDITAICTLSSLVLKNFIIDGVFDFELLAKATKKIVKALNRVVDINHYSTEKGKRGGLSQRAIGIGVQGLADAFFLMDYEFTSEEARKLNKEIFETIYFAAITESKDLVKNKEFTKYEHFDGSPFSKGDFQFDMWGLKEEEFSGKYDWVSLKKEVSKYGIANSLLTAVMPTASCQVSSTRIHTNSGIKSFRDILEENDIDCDKIEKTIDQKWFELKNPIEVKTQEGYEIVNKIKYNGHSTIINIEMEDGTFFEATPNHMFKVNRNGVEQFIETEQLIEGDDIVNVFQK